MCFEVKTIRPELIGHTEHEFILHFQIHQHYPSLHRFLGNIFWDYSCWGYLFTAFAGNPYLRMFVNDKTEGQVMSNAKPKRLYRSGVLCCQQGPLHSAPGKSHSEAMLSLSALFKFRTLALYIIPIHTYETLHNFWVQANSMKTYTPSPTSLQARSTTSFSRIQCSDSTWHSPCMYLSQPTRSILGPTSSTLDESSHPWLCHNKPLILC